MEERIEVGRIIIQRYLLEDTINIMLTSGYVLEIAKINEQECLVIIMKRNKEGEK
jgi:hypothetical protein